MFKLDADQLYTHPTCKKGEPCISAYYSLYGLFRGDFLYPLPMNLWYSYVPQISMGHKLDVRNEEHEIGSPITSGSPVPFDQRGSERWN